MRAVVIKESVNQLTCAFLSFFLFSFSQDVLVGSGRRGGGMGGGGGVEGELDGDGEKRICPANYITII